MTDTRAAPWSRLWEIAVVLLTLFAPARGSGQTQGTVVVIDVADAITGAPLQNARVRISDLRRLARTDWIGEARLPDVPAGEHRIEARQLGYAPVETHLLVRGESIGVVFRLLRSAETLDTIRINGSVIPRYLKEFELRRQMGLGRYLTSRQLDSVPSEAVADMAARRFPGLRAEWNTERTAVRLVSTRGPASFTQECRPQVYIDGSYLGADELLGSLAAGDVVGVEYYSIAPPAQYTRAGPGCGSILFWTRRW